MTPTTTKAPPHAVLWDLSTRAFVARCIHVVAELGVADAIGDDGADVADVAVELGVDADALGRVLRALSPYGVFDVDLPQVRHTEASRLLRRDHPMSMAAFAEMMGSPMSWDALTPLRETVETGRAGVFDLDPDGLFAYLRRHDDQAQVFDRAMTAKSHADILCILGAYDFGGGRRVADIGGGRGHLLDAIAQQHPGVAATLFEQPEVVDRVAAERAPDDDRLHLVAGDFFRDELPVADVYVLMEIIHDWDDDDAARILSNIRRSAPDDAALLIIETVLREGPGLDPAKTLDIVMLTVTGGRERTPAEYAALMARAGFELARVIPTAGAVHLVEARPALRP